jgi:two-component system response regulator YesN
MREIQKTNKNTLFIVMTAYDKFNYAKEAANLGVFKFLNKPVNKQHVVEVIREAMKTVEEERQKRNNDLEIKEKMESVVPIIENGFLTSVLANESSDREIEQYKTLLGIEEEYGYVVVVELGEEVKGTKLSNPIGSGVKMQRFYPEFREYCKDYLNCFIGPIAINRVTLFIPAEDDEMEYDNRISTIEKCRVLSRKLKEKCSLEIRMGIGTVKRTNETEGSYSEAIQALKYGDSRVNHIEDLDMQSSFEDNYPAELERKLFILVEKGDTAKVKIVASEFFDWMVDNHSNDVMNIKLKAIEFVLASEKLAFGTGGMKYNFSSRSEYLSTVIEIGSLSLLKEWYLNKIELATKSVATKKEDKLSNIVSKAKTYIDENYEKELTLDSVARKIAISPYYLSKLFKDEIGENFIEYLTRLRIERAKKLLEENQLSIKEICMSVGYSDPNYFSRIFKKVEGVTPTEYRDS